MNRVKDFVGVALSIGAALLAIGTFVAIVHDLTSEEGAQRAQIEYTLALQEGRL